MAAKTNEGGSEEASRRLASSEKGKNQAVRRKSDRLQGPDCAENPLYAQCKRLGTASMGMIQATGHRGTTQFLKVLTGYKLSDSLPEIRTNLYQIPLRVGNHG